MRRSAALAADLARQAEYRARLRAEHGLQRWALAATAGVLAFGALVFASVGLVLLLGPVMGVGLAALLVAVLWLLAAVGVLIALLQAWRRKEPSMLPDDAPDRIVTALGADLGANAPLVTLAAFVAGILAGRQR
ncbi:hypothetical protein LNKW23_13790 [Paralimibaculum aggregatum]|uniref:Phage holin family protein n=1 Tax=Paralimibaculum aggregatum TaxID=3036245 RepID=A0ABQ6LIA1_9RHOB|nr:phage holin family protein [Limibaculum sp. NKW23]GMG82166.1 hypothetical protein LNKW23_13790 [Limibaculum sp. NKW23]